MIDGYNGLPLVERRWLHTWVWYCALFTGIISLYIAHFLRNLPQGFDYRTITFPIVVYVALVCFVWSGLMVCSDLLYIVPPREQWGERSFWCVDTCDQVTEASPGFHWLKRTFSLADGDMVQVNSLTGLGIVLETRHLRIGFTTPPTRDVVSAVVNWYEEHRRGVRLRSDQKFEQYLEFETFRTDLPFEVEVVPKL